VIGGRSTRASGYDVFLSHSHVDKDWTRTLHDHLAGADYNGRMLRPWLDQEVLDPGTLASDRELESALDRSRFLALVLSPEALESTWVQAEIAYFLRTRSVDDVIVLKRQPCRVPSELSRATLIGWPDPDAADQHARLLSVLRPHARQGSADHDFRKSMRRAWAESWVSQPVGYDDTPTEENSRLLELLLSFDIGDLDHEGSALVAFERVGQLVSELSLRESYGAKMVLGEFLAIAMLHDSRYGRVMANYVTLDSSSHLQGPTFNTLRNRALRGAQGPPSTTNLLFAVARAGSKLAEIDRSRIDLSTMGALLHQLDQRGIDSPGEQTVAGMIGRLLGKLRNTPVADVLIRTLAEWGGDASCLAAAGAISTRFHDADLRYHTEELAKLSAEAQPARPPSPSTARLLLDKSSRLWLRPGIDRQIQNSLIDLQDLIRSFGSDWPAGDAIGSSLRLAPQPTNLVNGPLIGRVRLVTRANMESYADTLGPADIACLTEPRIVDALFDGVSGYLIAHDEVDKPLGIRLQRRSARFATYGADEIRQLEDDAVIALWPGRTRDDATGFTAPGAG
jgi:TIR domain